MPLFPLQVVLFPRTPLALHIFEDRYKEMIGEAMQSNSEFGVVLAGEKGIVESGCTAVVDRVAERYPDGRLDIIAVGRRRFEILSLNQEREFLRGGVSFFDDEDADEQPLPDDVRAEVLQCYQELVELGSNSSLLDSELTPGEPLSFQLAQVITDLTQRQLLLMARSENNRMRQLAGYLPALVRQRRELLQAKRGAASNGHAKRPAGL